MTMKELKQRQEEAAEAVRTEQARLEKELGEELWNELPSAARVLLKPDYQELPDDVRAACFLKAAFKRVGLAHVPTDIYGESAPRWSLPARCRSEGDWAAPPDCLPLDD